MFCKDNIEKFKTIVCFLGLGSTKAVKRFYRNLNMLSDGENLKIFEEIITEKAKAMIKDGIIQDDKYGHVFFKIIEEMRFESIKKLLLKKNFNTEELPYIKKRKVEFLTLQPIKKQKSQNFFQLEVIEPSIKEKSLNLNNEPLDLSCRRT